MRGSGARQRARRGPRCSFENPRFALPAALGRALSAMASVSTITSKGQRQTRGEKRGRQKKGT